MALMRILIGPKPKTDNFVLVQPVSNRKNISDATLIVWGQADLAISSSIETLTSSTAIQAGWDLLKVSTTRPPPSWKRAGVLDGGETVRESMINGAGRNVATAADIDIGISIYAPPARR